MAVLIGAFVGAFLGLVFDYVESTKSMALTTGMTGERLVGGAVIGVVVALALAVIRIRSRAFRSP
ncbi:hypothetical protein [Allomesorhizobium alhagi]|nr:hypothetical protein [Mesorhizobium alhagi]